MSLPRRSDGRAGKAGPVLGRSVSGLLRVVAASMGKDVDAVMQAMLEMNGVTCWADLPERDARSMLRDLGKTVNEIARRQTSKGVSCGDS